ncbi:2'-5' RNA ligase, partial [Candidatus Gottesmanbacteria bacterium RBG_13_37_7]
SLKEISQLEIEFDQVGFFDRNELIIWLGIKKNPHLVNLARKLDQQMGKLGFSVESRMFSPHVTIGRGKRLEDKEKNEVKDFIDNATTILPSQFSVSYISLMQSVLTTNGPIYSEIERFDITN